MKRITEIPTKAFILQVLKDPSISKIIENWSVEYEVIADSISEYLEDMGVYRINPVTQRDLIIETTKSQLFNNSKIQNRIRELAQLANEQIARKRKTG